jgi:hypothetical protein
MTDTLSQWLRVREDADARARSTRLTDAITSRLAGRAPIRVLDLATGAGSNVRHLVPNLPSPQSWLAVDQSEALLTDLRTRTVAWAIARGAQAHADARTCRLQGDGLDVEIETRAHDLDTLDAHLFDGRDLVTASALLDLVSASWLRGLAWQCRRVGAAALFTITYNGLSACDPSEPEDDAVRVLLNTHQRRDKGLGGPAEGPQAIATVVSAFEGVGYELARESSDWHLGPDEPEVQRLLVEGWADAATEMEPQRSPEFATWRERRLRHIARGQSSIVVGHDDVAAWPLSRE